MKICIFEKVNPLPQLSYVKKEYRVSSPSCPYIGTLWLEGDGEKYFAPADYMATLNVEYLLRITEFAATL